MISSPSRYEIFLKVAEYGNISQAAKTLNYTQSGVSHAIAKLEKEAGFPLFIRSRTGVRLTESGKLLIGPIRDLVYQKRSLDLAIQSMSQTIGGTLRIGSFASVAATWLPDLIASFRSVYPKITVHVSDGSYDEVAEMLTREAIDCAFLSRSVSSGLAFRHVMNDPLLAALPRGHALAGNPSIPLPELLDYPFIEQSVGCDNDTRELLKNAPKDPHVRYVLRDDNAVMAFIAHGEGVGILPGLVLENSRYPLRMVPLDPPRFRDIGIVTLPGSRLTIAAKAFLQYVSEQYAPQLSE